jgi:NAD(P)-dependent dehydrogenase (short-subunit alcohol dehydrogenase family)
VGTDLAGNVVLVTGASIGIGREIALRFAAAGCRLALTYFEHRAEAEEVAERCREAGSPDVLAVSLQLADEDSQCTLLERVVDHFGVVDVLVNNAGVISWKPFLEQGFGEIDEQVNVNLLGVMKLTWCFLPLVTDAVITVGSTATLHQSRTPPTYCATKWGLRGFVKALALEHPGKRIVSVHPTVTATRMNDMRGMSPERVADVIYRVAAGEIEVEPGGDVDLREYADA